MRFKDAHKRRVIERKNPRRGIPFIVTGRMERIKNCKGGARHDKYLLHCIRDTLISISFPDTIEAIFLSTVMFIRFFDSFNQFLSFTKYLLVVKESVQNYVQCVVHIYIVYAYAYFPRSYIHEDYL